MAEYEIHRIQLPGNVSRSAVRQLLTEHAEYGGWELARMRRYPDGRRTITVRRRVLRATKTLYPYRSDLLT